MRLIFSLSILLGVSISLRAQVMVPHCYGESVRVTGGYYPCETYDEWLLVFEDNFNDTTLDYSIWQDHYPWGRNLYCTTEIQYYSDGENYAFNNGCLNLIAIEESVYERTVDRKADNDILFCEGDTVGINKRSFDYTSGMIFSRQKFLYGKFEIRCKVPGADRLNPAFWLYGGCSQEIDVFEFLDYGGFLQNRRTSHTYHRRPDCTSDEKLQCMFKKIRLTDLSKKFYTYSFEWDKHVLIWRIDGREIRRVVRWHDRDGRGFTMCGDIEEDLYYWDRIFPLDDVPMWIIANLAVRPEPTASFPSTMEIDYIRVYQKIDSLASVNNVPNKKY